MLKQRSTWTAVVFQEMQMPKVPGIKHVQDQAQREGRPLEVFLEPPLGLQVKHTKENEFRQRHMTKKATIHVGCVEGITMCLVILFLSLISRVFDKVKSRSAHMKSHVVKPGGK